MPQFQRRTDDELREVGPFAPVQLADAPCEACGCPCDAFTVVNLASGIGINAEWSNFDYAIKAEECAKFLNSVWRQGFEAGQLRSKP